MPVRRITTTVYRRKRRNRLAKSRYITKAPRMMKQIYPVSRYSKPSHFFKRKTFLGPVVIPATSVTGFVGAAQFFTLSNLPNYTEFTTLFDQYCITYVKWNIVFRSSNISVMETSNIASQPGLPNIIAVRDYDDNSSPPSDLNGYREIQQYSKAKSFIFTAERRSFTMGLVPATLSETYRSGISTAYKTAFKSNIDCDTPDVPHYGIRYVLQAPSTIGTNLGVTYNFDLYATFYVKMKNVR